MIHSDIGHRCDLRSNHIGRIEPTTETNLEHTYINACPCKRLKAEDGDRFEEGQSEAEDRLPNFFCTGEDLLFGQRPPSHEHPFPKRTQMR